MFDFLLFEELLKRSFVYDFSICVASLFYPVLFFKFGECSREGFGCHIENRGDFVVFEGVEDVKMVDDEFGDFGIGGEDHLLMDHVGEDLDLSGERFDDFEADVGIFEKIVFQTFEIDLEYFSACDESGGRGVFHIFETGKLTYKGDGYKLMDIKFVPFGISLVESEHTVDQNIERSRLVTFVKDDLSRVVCFEIGEVFELSEVLFTQFAKQRYLSHTIHICTFSYLKSVIIAKDLFFLVKEDFRFSPPSQKREEG